MLLGPTCRAIAVSFLLACVSTGTAEAADTSPSVQFNPEIYTLEGQANGCGISFTAAWIDEEQELVGVVGSVNLFLAPERKTVLALIKATGFINGKETPIKYAWVQTNSYGRTLDFKSSPSADPKGFVGGKPSDPKTVTIPLDMAYFGSVLGITFDRRSFDDSVTLPAAPKDVAAKVDQCFAELQQRIQMLDEK